MILHSTHNHTQVQKLQTILGILDSWGIHVVDVLNVGGVVT